MPQAAGAVSSMPETQAAIVTLCMADPTFTSLCHGIFDPAPENQALPYVTCGEHIETPWPVFRNAGWQILLLFHIWSVQPGFSECFAIHNAMSKLLNYQQLTLVEYANVIVMPEDATKLNDPDGITHHLVVRWRAFNMHL